MSLASLGKMGTIMSEFVDKVMFLHAIGNGDELRQHLEAREAVVEKLVKALNRLSMSFPSDFEMRDAGWLPHDIKEACDAYDAARAVLTLARGEKP